MRSRPSLSLLEKTHANEERTEGDEYPEEHDAHRYSTMQLRRNSDSYVNRDVTGGKSARYSENSQNKCQPSQFRHHETIAPAWIESGPLDLLGNSGKEGCSVPVGLSSIRK